MEGCVVWRVCSAGCCVVYAGSRTHDNCNSGCLNNWLGDRYCDQVGQLLSPLHFFFTFLTPPPPPSPPPQACRVPSCGYDAGDCGTEQWETLYSLKPRPNHTYFIPLGTAAMFFNLSSYFSNGTVLSAEHSPCPTVRTAVLAQTFKTLSLTFSKNTSRSYSCITINGTSGSGAVVTVRAGGGAGAVYSVSIACGLSVFRSASMCLWTRPHPT